MLHNLMDRVASFREQHSGIDKVTQLRAMMPPHPGFTRFNKPYMLVTQWSGKQMKALRCEIVPVCAATLSNSLASEWIPSTEDLLCVKIFV